MRELKFRVWSNYWKKFATEAELYMDGSVDAVFEDDGGVPHHENTDLVLEFDTGLKDENGKEIYEGDIVRFRTDHHSKDLEGVGGVSMCELPDSDGWENDGYLCWAIDGYISLSCATTEIIGNIHENQYLLDAANTINKEEE